MAFFYSIQLDSKSCPLALLAKTCRQIGADSSDIGAVVGNGSSNISASSGSDNNKINSSQRRSIPEFIPEHFRKNYGSKSRENESPSITISPTALGTSSKSPCQRLQNHNGNSDKSHSDALNVNDQNNPIPVHSRSSPVEVNLIASTTPCFTSPTKDISSLSSLSSLSSVPSSYLKSPERANAKEHFNGKSSNDLNHFLGEAKGSTDMPRLMEHKSIIDDIKDENKNGDIAAIANRPSASLAQGSKSQVGVEKNIENTLKHDLAAKKGFDALANHSRSLPLGTHTGNNVVDKQTPNMSEGLQNYLMYQGLSHYGHNSASTSATLSPHLALALAAGAAGRHPYLSNNGTGLSGSISSGTHPVPPSGVCRDPLCRDPLCPTSLRNQQLLAAATGNWSASSVLSHYSSLLSNHQRESMISAAQRQAIQASMLAATAAGSSPGSAGGALPYVCNWVSGV